MAKEMKRLPEAPEVYDPSFRYTDTAICGMLAEEKLMCAQAHDDMAATIKVLWKMLEPHVVATRCSRDQAFRTVSIGMITAWKKGHIYEK
jgi:hypothetical protein